jgi:hypothetical protein
MELFAIVRTLEHLYKYVYIYGQEFHLPTENSTLTWLMNFKNIEHKTAAWIHRLREYFIFEQRQEQKHSNADVLSRRQCRDECNRLHKVEARADVKQLLQL